MKKVKIYTTNYCPYCSRAKSVMDRHGVSYEEIDASGDDALRKELVEKTGMMTVPQIFIGEVAIGGCQELEALVQEGKFLPMVEGD